MLVSVSFPVAFCGSVFRDQVGSFLGALGEIQQIISCDRKYFSNSIDRMKGG
jgi:hypothetical protein